MKVIKTVIDDNTLEDCIRRIVDEFYSAAPKYRTKKNLVKMLLEGLV